jgi:hypothetical protein
VLLSANTVKYPVGCRERRNFPLFPPVNGGKVGVAEADFGPHAPTPLTGRAGVGLLTGNAPKNRELVAVSVKRCTKPLRHHNYDMER